MTQIAFPQYNDLFYPFLVARLAVSRSLISPNVLLSLSECAMGWRTRAGRVEHDFQRVVGGVQGPHCDIQTGSKANGCER